MAILRKTLLFLIAAGVSAVFFLNLCDFLFQCGCQSPGAGAAQFCNLHTPEVPHCPWCSYGLWGFLLPIAAIWSAQASVVFPAWKLSERARLLLGLACLPLVGAILGWLFALYSGYPTFLFLKLF